MADRTPDAAMGRKLTVPQVRHLIELYGDGKRFLYWRPANSGEERCALTLRGKGLVEGSFISYSDGYWLTLEGVEVARALIEARRG